MSAEVCAFIRGHVELLAIPTAALVCRPWAPVRGSLDVTRSPKAWGGIEAIPVEGWARLPSPHSFVPSLCRQGARARDTATHSQVPASCSRCLGNSVTCLCEKS